MSLNVIIFLIIIGGMLFGKISTKAKLPNVLGMLFWGILISISTNNLLPYFTNIDIKYSTTFTDISPFIKSTALIIILLRAGLGIKKQTLKKVGLPALLMAFIPCLFEAGSLTIALHLLFKFDWIISAMTAFILSAVSPAVVVPSMLEFKEKNLGEKNDVPTLILAGASIDDVVAITFFTMFLNLATKTGTNTNIYLQMLMIPSAILGGIIAGLIIGLILIYFFKKFHFKIQSSEKILITLALCLIFFQIGETIHIATLLGVMTIGFIFLEKDQEIANLIASKLGKLWIGAEIFLFVIIGMQLNIDVAIGAGLKGLAVILIGLTARSFGVIIALIPSKLSRKEKLFCIFAYIPKATVQAAMGSIPLAAGVKEGETILAIAVLAIIVTAPLGLLLIRNTGSRLLKE
ncbi:MAG: cation:proton antiporter [Spirochaetales bacterium]|nr:cation:proton antiporter [Spirochaetales bacterium]